MYSDNMRDDQLANIEKLAMRLASWDIGNEGDDIETVAFALLKEMGVDRSAEIWEIPLIDPHGPHAIITFRVPKFADIEYIYFNLFVGYGLDKPNILTLEITLLSHEAKDDNDCPVLFSFDIHNRLFSI